MWAIIHFFIYIGNVCEKVKTISPYGSSYKQGFNNLQIILCEMYLYDSKVLVFLNKTKENPFKYFCGFVAHKQNV